MNNWFRTFPFAIMSCSPVIVNFNISPEGACNNQVQLCIGTCELLLHLVHKLEGNIKVTI